MNMRKYNKQIQERLLQALELPHDVIFDLPKISVIGDIQFYLENHRGIIAYSPTEIRIAVSIGEVRIEGEGLIIRTITRDEIHLEGRIYGIRYQR